jgi:hypothetical protein
MLSVYYCVLCDVLVVSVECDLCDVSTLLYVLCDVLVVSVECDLLCCQYIIVSCVMC